MAGPPQGAGRRAGDPHSTTIRALHPPPHRGRGKGSVGGGGRGEKLDEGTWTAGTLTT